MITSMFLSLLHRALDIFATGKRVKQTEYGLEIPDNFLFYEPKKAIKLDKKQNINDGKNLLNFSQEVSYMACYRTCPL